MTSVSARSVAAPIACAAVFAMALSMSYPLVSLLLERLNESSFRIGVANACAALGMLAAGALMGRLFSSIGVARTLAICLIGCALTIVALKLWLSYWPILFLRFLLGVSATGVILGSEYWIVANASAQTRGKVVGLYAAALSIGLAAGPSIVALAGVGSWAPFAIAAVGCLAALAPLAWGWSAAPSTLARAQGGVWRYFLSDPTLIWAVALFGVLEFGAMALLPVWGVRLGMPEQAALWLVSVVALGNAAFQPMIGRLVGRAPARMLLVCLASASILVGAIAPQFAGVYALIAVLIFIWGGMTTGLYTVALADLGARYQGAPLAAATGALVTAYGFGALIGPPAVGAAMDVAGPSGLFWAAAAFSALYIFIALWRSRRTRRLT